jgi:UDP-N-acetylglucosamine:LPS N-acetylglucosamine transferase
MDPYQIKDQRILIAPLNWGLGHATRSAKLIQILKEKNTVFLASDGNALNWLSLEFPYLECVELPELKMKYSKIFGAAGGILFRLPHFIRSIRKDYIHAKRLVKEYKIDLIISDNRYGVYNEECRSVLLTHQLQIPHPLFALISGPFQILLNKFDEIWVPDDKEHSLSGRLSMPEEELRIPVHYIGRLSRFQGLSSPGKKDIKFLLIASGPEPFRKQLIDYFEFNFHLINENCHIVYGKEPVNEKPSSNVTRHGLVDSKSLENLILRSELVMCRSGYSSIMDLIEMKQNAVLIPTPGQAEQKYLAELHAANPQFECVIKSQDLPKILKRWLAL